LYRVVQNIFRNHPNNFAFSGDKKDQMKIETLRTIKKSVIHGNVLLGISPFIRGKK